MSAKSIIAAPPQRPEHPARHPLGLPFALFGPPIAWAIQLLLGVTLVNTNCEAALYAASWLRPTILGINIIALIIAVGSILLSVRMWQQTRGEAAGAAGSLIEAGEGRVRFLAVWSILVGAGFAVAVLFNIIALAVVPACD